MPLIEWSDRYRTGLPEVDHEHQRLIETINTLYNRLPDEAGTDEIQDVLGEIHALIEAHFALEERIMRATKYDQYDAHKTDHDRLLEDIRDIMDGVAEGSLPILAEALGDRLTDWFSIHFTTHDRRLHKLGRTAEGG